MVRMLRRRPQRARSFRAGCSDYASSLSCCYGRRCWCCVCAGVAAAGAGAVGVWGVVGLELYYLPCWTCSQQVISAESEWSISDGAFAATYQGSNGDVVDAMLTYGGARRENGSTIASATAVRQVRKWAKICFSNGECAVEATTVPVLLKNDNLTDSLFTTPRGTYPESSSDLPRYARVGSATSTAPGTGPAFVSMTSRPLVGTQEYVMCESGAPCSSKKFPSVESGSWNASGPRSDSFSSSPVEGQQFINAVVADPEAPTVDPDAPQTDPDPNWDPNTDPFSPLYDPFADPEGDPDHDGIPNKDDDDPEGDGDPDGDGDPNEHRPLAPWPATDDPEQDGDPDGDGDPNETNPYVSPAPLPIDDPDSDPDGDGIPNKDDDDDDGDGVPDADDPAPYDPTIPGSDPGGDPGGDPAGDPDTDGDGVPDTIDPHPNDPLRPAEWVDGDRDGDFIPDTRDPAPDDPTVPDPTDPPSRKGDLDRDGVPNQHDPYPDDPALPQGSPSGDLDEDGIPNRHDPDPYRRSQPSGGPGGDADGDGIPNSDDPYPNDPNEPNEPGSEGGICPAYKPYKFEIPKLKLLNVFPFSLVLKAWNIMQSLVMPPERPVFKVPLMGDLTVSDSIDAQVQTVKTAISVVLFIGMLFWFWRMVTGKGSDGGGST